MLIYVNEGAIYLMCIRNCEILHKTVVAVMGMKADGSTWAWVTIQAMDEWLCGSDIEAGFKYRR